MKKLTISNAKILRKLIEVQIISGSEFKAKKFLEQLKEENILKTQQLNRSQSKIHLINNEDLKSFIKNEFNIKDLNNYIKVMYKEMSSRSEVIKVSGDSKIKNIQTQTGLYLAGYENVILQIDDKKFNIVNILEGTSLFIHQNTMVGFSEDILIVGVENAENLLQIKKQKYLFKNIPKAKLFVLINPTMLKFLETINNEYLHFGDFDLAGISIYETKTKPKIKKSSFFIPDSIEETIKNGNKELYFKQYEKYKGLKSKNKNIQVLIEIIHKYKKVVEQELFVTKQ